MTDLECIGWAIADLDPVLSEGLTKPIPALHMPDKDDDLRAPTDAIRVDPSEGVSIFLCGDRCGGRVAVMASMAADMGAGLWFLPGHAPDKRSRVGMRYCEQGLA